MAELLKHYLHHVILKISIESDTQETILGDPTPGIWWLGGNTHISSHGGRLCMCIYCFISDPYPVYLIEAKAQCRNSLKVKAKGGERVEERIQTYTTCYHKHTHTHTHSPPVILLSNDEINAERG